MTSKSIGFALLAALALSRWASADMPKDYQFKGEVTKLTPDIIELRGERGGENVTLQFRNSAIQLPSNLKRGDHVTIYYRLDAYRIRGEASRGPQEPGRVPPEEDPAKKGIIRDDRAFYDARNDSRPSPGPDTSPRVGG